ncbi:XdhC family aldehyde oxidoreductase maturation factor [Desulforamulus ruminis]|uniref:XshC-Cox1-family protein n=1 Tax=Desulforamulus ruminis (strain ATCC 23193 / DSM 2154 / NCIMB 8452 / DL) TaxID=696281 RepID=F6DS54_DESRL|nr:XdhC/CoxI family protein [Desulforamulus ruminis]AEG58816.1 protein of unknown function DUF182 [Desulforamulus ruminis DSM 2154]
MMKKLYRSAWQLIKNGECFVQATVLTQSGSSPRTAGAKMIVRQDQSIVGTIGGGLVEAEVQKMAQDIFETKESIIRQFNLTGAQSGEMGMICGGKMEILVEYLDAADPLLHTLYQDIIKAIETGEKTVLVTPLSQRKKDQGAEAFLIKNTGSITGLFNGPAAWLERLAGAAKGKYPRVVVLEENRFLLEPINTYGTVYIFGAGHVSQKLALLTSMVDFVTVILDDRAAFANRERFPTADRVVVLENFEQAFTNLGINEESYVVIVTRGHAHDQTVLAQALKTTACYIGMIGSQKKRDTLYRALKKQGFSAEELAKVYAPIGLDIDAETPEEIAVSITAELIKVRAGQN